MATDTKLDSLVINYLTQSQYDTAKNNGTLNANQIYMTPASSTNYTLPTATSSTLGGVKIGNNITVNSGTISLTKANVTSALGYTPPTTDTKYTLPSATNSTLGGVKIGNNITVSSGTISLTKANVTNALLTSGSNSLNIGNSNDIIMSTHQSGVGSGATYQYYYGVTNGLVVGTNNKINTYKKSSSSISIPTSSILDGIVCGKYCNSTPDGDYPKKDIVFLIGNGTSSATSNAFRINTDGTASGRTYSSSGADYAEMFEWQDGNPDGEDRRGMFVTLDGKHIRLANSKDTYILGIVSGNPTVLGDTAEDQWVDMYECDIFGALKHDSTTENGLVLNPNYDNEKQYVARGQRKEWDAVGLMGKLVVVDDGTCEVNGFCATNDNGIGTKAETGYRVMERLDKNHIRVFVK